MDTTTVHTPTAHETPSALLSQPPPRLALIPAGSVPTRIDGAWWPRSRDLTAELRALTEVLERRWDRITRVTVNPAHWPVIPHKVEVNGHVVKVGWFKEQDPHQLMLLSYRTGRWDLLVIPPQTPAATAAWLMAAATDPPRTSTGSRLMAEAFRRAADEAEKADEADEAERESVWDSEGGSTRPTVLHGP